MAVFWRIFFGLAWSPIGLLKQTPWLVGEKAVFHQLLYNLMINPNTNFQCATFLHCWQQDQTFDPFNAQYTIAAVCVLSPWETPHMWDYVRVLWFPWGVSLTANLWFDHVNAIPGDRGHPGPKRAGAGATGAGPGENKERERMAKNIGVHMV